MMNTPRYHNLGITAYIDAGKTTTTERILQLTGKMKRSGKRTDWETTENCTSQPTVGERITAERIAKILP